MSIGTGERRTGAQTRAEILRVALRLFTEKGYEGTSTRDISSALGITKSSLYYHFENKEAIVASLAAERRRDVDDLVEWILVQPATPDLPQRAVLRWVESTTPERLQAMRLAMANQPIMRRLVERGEDVRSAFDRVVDVLVPDDASPTDRLLIRMAFDTVGAALVAAEPAGTDPAEVLAAAQRASVALTEAVARPARPA